MNGFDGFLELAGRTYPEIEWEYTAYAGANRTGYSWAQMRSDDIPDIFITSQIIDNDLAKERLVDLADYDFVNGLSTALLDQVAIDGGIYVLPVNNVMYGIYYNKTLMEEHNWALPNNVAFTAASYTEEVGEAYNVQVEEGTLSTFVRTWLEEQGAVSPDGNPWE